MPNHIDGNVLAGALSEVFSADITSATATCVGCGDRSPIALAMVYPKPGAYIARCHLCDSVLLTLIRSTRELRLDLSGVTSLSFAV